MHILFSKIKNEKKIQIVNNLEMDHLPSWTSQKLLDSLSGLESVAQKSNEGMD